jgi:hypothetical protein
VGVLVLGLGLPPSPSLSQENATPAQRDTAPTKSDGVIAALISGSFVVVSGDDKVVASLRRNDAPVETLTEADVVEAIERAARTADDIVALWELLAGQAAPGLVTLPIVKALATATNSPRTREALWSELSELARIQRPRSPAEAGNLLAFFERHREALLPLLPAIRESEGGGDEMAKLMSSTRVFGEDFSRSLLTMLSRNPGAVARLIERERERGRPVKWEKQAFEGMMRWKEAHLVGGAPHPPRTLQELDAAGESFITIFNALHSLDDWYRKQMLRGLGPVELFNAAVGGEQELYRLGTSGYRGFIHAIILKGIKDTGSFEAFLAKATPTWLGEAGPAIRSQRAMVFVRIASSFGLLDSVLETFGDRDRFITEAIMALGDPRAFEGSSTIVLDVLTASSNSQLTADFKRALLDRLYGLYRIEASAARRSVYGSMLSAYQTVTGDQRDSAIGREFPLDRSLMQVPFERLFVRQTGPRLVHRMFMRMHDDIDGAATYASFRVMMRSLGASINERKSIAIFRIAGRQRMIEIYVNRPSEDGVRQGIADIANLLGDHVVHTVIGRGHTGIITPLQTDSRRILGLRMEGVAIVMVGSCGSDASVRELIGTFGYVPIVTTKSTGRQVLNNAIIRAYIGELLELPPGGELSMARLLDRAMAPYLGKRIEVEVREDAALYRVNVATALAARLFDTHVLRHAEPRHSAANP